MRRGRWDEKYNIIIQVHSGLTLVHTLSHIHTTEPHPTVHVQCIQHRPTYHIQNISDKGWTVLPDLYERTSKRLPRQLGASQKKTHRCLTDCDSSSFPRGLPSGSASLSELKSSSVVVALTLVALNSASCPSCTVLPISESFFSN